MTNFIRVPQNVTLAAVDYVGAAKVSEAVFLVAFDLTQDAPYMRVSQAPVLVATQNYDTPKVSQAVALVAYGEGEREAFNLRAWGFMFDGHEFYVLHLGRLGTWIYDMLTGQWSQWQTEGYATWNAEQGLMWYDQIIAGDNQNGILWEIDPETQEDEGWRTIHRTTTAIIPARGRDIITHDGLYITASVGFPTSETPLVTLRFSDDYGNTWVDMDDCTVTLVDGETKQEIAFRSLGSFGAPGRVIEISDAGGVVRIDDCMTLDDLEG